MAPSADPDVSSQSARALILVPETISPDGLALLSPSFDVHVRPGLSPDELETIIPGYHGLIVRSETKVTAAVLRAGRKLKVVARAGVGVDNIDVAAATSQGVIVVNSPAGNIVAAAEHTIALLLATARNVGRADAGVKDGRWERSKLVGVEVGRKTLGIVGLGKVGLNVARMAKGLGMQVKAVDPYASADLALQTGVELVADLGSLLGEIDFLTIHTPLLATTMDLVGEPELRQMRPTARVLNVARGGVYNEAALLQALDEGWIAGAGLDVFTSEPPHSVAAQLARHPRVVATPHLGASTVEAQENVSMDVCKQVREILEGGLPTSAVNAPIILPGEYRKLQPVVRLMEQMGRLYTHYFVRSKGGGRKFEVVYHGDLACMTNTKPLFAALVKGLVASISDSNVNIVNATIIAKEKGIVISETYERQSKDHQAYSNLVTLKATADDGSEQVIEGYASDKRVYISKLDRFRAAFRPEGTLIILHNYDEPGKIGCVGMALGSHGINVHFMQVASLGVEAVEAQRDNEALMILGVDGEVGGDVLDELRRTEGVLDVSLREAAHPPTVFFPPSSYHRNQFNTLSKAFRGRICPYGSRSEMRRHGPSGAFTNLRPVVLGLGRLLGVAAAPLAARGADYDNDGEVAPLWVLAVASMALVLLGGAFAGLTIAIYLQVLSGDPAEPQHRNAKRVLNLLNRGKHWVLVTLLLANVIVNESLPVVLDRTLGGGVAAVVGSTIVPQSICVRYGLPIGGYMSKPVLVLMYLLSPVAWPTAKLLDWILGEDHGTVYKKSGLKTLVTLHKSLGDLSERLNQDEVTIITAVLDLKEKPVSEVMTPMDDVFTLAEDHILDEKTMDNILSSGYSRIPIFRAGNPTDFVGMLLVKTLITYDPEDRIPVRDVQLGAIVETRPETSCLDIINFFQEGKSHMVLVSEYPGSDHGALGVVTLEDVIEELIGEEIVDESDVYVDVHKAIRRLTPAPRAKRLHHDDGSPAVPTAAMAVKRPGDGSVLVDIAEHPDGPVLTVGSPGALSDTGGVAEEHHPKTAIFMKRRRSAGPDGKAERGTVPIKASLDEMKRQLRLGPANRAARPRNTRTNVFKIKQGLTTGPGTGSNGKLVAKAAAVESEETPLLPTANGGRPSAGGYGSGETGKKKPEGGAAAVGEE
ncbi:hypothetical protein L249_8515 [Ophiocordyceps polyrhachis-furcata BCC 54312]|uniref:D-3-phosphoglycerate dehydrogenase n=1 Tax=Ophiocordyceps polyrhachis-furcata BCC 54312 TaxID=1330021 RepID=A0A367L713_9HYPO|nr:hypothetical protein L249_8515 [Ophiocordyceps polyrhachis-furcata BCC 54312]